MSGSAHSKAMRCARINFLHGLRKERAGLHGRVVGDDHARNAGDIADARDCAGGGNAAPLFVHFVGGPEPDLEKRRTLIEQAARCVRAPVIGPSCAGGPGRLCRRLRAKSLLLSRVARSARAKFRAVASRTIRDMNARADLIARDAGVSIEATQTRAYS